MSQLEAIRRAAPRAAQRSQARRRLTCAGVTVARCAWRHGGGVLDDWAHHHGQGDASCFPPWHAILDTGFMAVAGWWGGTWVHHGARGATWQGALPPGYALSGVGVRVFAAGGMGDLVWHRLFGVAPSLEALYRPTPLTLAVGSALSMSGPVRAAWQRPDHAATPGWQPLVPMLLALTCVLAGFTFSAPGLHPWLPLRRVASLPGSDERLWYLHALTIGRILVPIMLNMGVVLLARRRWRVPVGSLTLVLTRNGRLMCPLDPHDDQGLIIPVLLTGLMADGLLAQLQPAPDRPWAFRLFASLVPVVFSLCYFGALLLMKGW